MHICTYAHQVTTAARDIDGLLAALTILKVESHHVTRLRHAALAIL